MNLPTIPRVLAKTAIRAVLLLLFIGVPSALVYVQVVGIGFGLPERVGEALSSGQIETKIGKLSFDLIDGFVARDVTLRSTAGSGRTLAGISRVTIAPNLTALLTRQIVIDRASLHNARAKIPLEGDDGSVTQTLEVRDVFADLTLTEESVRVTRFDAVLQGIRLRATGSLANTGSFPLDPGSGDGNATKDVVRQVLEVLSKVSFRGMPPTLSFQFSGDLKNLAAISVDPISLQSGPIAGEGWAIGGLAANGRYSGGVFSLDNFELKGADGGGMKVWAILRGTLLEFEANSTLDPARLSGLFPSRDFLKDLSFKTSPRITLQGTADFADPQPKVQVTGSLSLDAFTFRNVDCDAFDAEFAWKEGDLFVREARLQAQGGTVQADVMLRPEDVRLRASSNIKPTAFAPALDAKARKVLADMEFRDAPEVRVSLRGTRFDFPKLKGGGTLKLGRTAMRGVWIDSAESPFEIADAAITYKDFKLTHGKGVGTGTFTYDFAGQQVRLHNILSTMNPVDVMMWIDPKIAESVRPYRFRENPTVRVEGSVHMKDVHQNNMMITIESADGLDYDLLGKTLPFGKTSATVHIDGGTVRAKVARAKLMGGDASVNANVSIDPKKPVFDAAVDFRHLNFAKLTKLYFDYDSSQGVASGNYAFHARMGHEEDMVGKGSLRVENGDVFAIPIFGPLSGILDKILNGVGHEAARLATSDFTISDRKIHTDNLTIEGRGFQLIGNGDIFFMKDRMDMSIRINARGLPGIVLFPVSKLFEYISTGTVSNPEWRPKIIPRFHQR